MTVHIVISKLTGHIMAVYTNYSLASKHWSIEQYNILSMPVTTH